MAHLSSSRRGAGFRGMAALAALLVLGALGFAGCSNDDPHTNGGKMRVDLRGLISQMNSGSGFSTMSAGVDDSPASTAVKSLIIGAVVITFTSTPLDETTQVDSNLSDKLASDVINSINFFSIVDLPTSADFVEFKVPPPGAGHWQVAAVGTKDTINTFDQLNDNNEAIYYGFDPHFHTTSASTSPDVNITMNRACFIDSPPKGCAAYTDRTHAVVTGEVEITAVLNEAGGAVSGLPAMPMVVRASGGTHTPATAQSALQAASLGSVSEVTVRMTHKTAAGVSAACASSALTVVALEANCGTGTAVTPF